MNDLSLLSHVVLKAKYCPNEIIVEAAHCYKTSFIWSSLLIGKILVDEYSTWKVGDGKDIEVWHDKWIPKPPDCMVTSF